ncbi:MAG: sugar ABC transporter permease [Chloroflexota bacterium]|nr:MAG: sugar ABC transporter permease [Chloroflexota bacterium]
MVDRARRRVSPARLRHVVEAYLFLSPWLIGYVALTFVPVLFSIYYSFTSYDVISPEKWIGLQNYVDAFTRDDQFWPSLGKTAYYAGMTVPLGVVGSLLLAVFLNVRVWGTSIFRTLFFIPSLVPIVASTVLWFWLLQPDWGPVNRIVWLTTGIIMPRWFQDPSWALPALISLALWTSLGGTRMIIFLAGLQGVPDELYDAAKVDGAGAWARFWHVTLPMLTPTIFFNLVLGIVGALQVFTSALVATEGGPAYATWFYALHIYKEAFQYFNMGYASALAWLFAVLIVFLTWVQMRFARSWVYYGGEK